MSRQRRRSRTRRARAQLSGLSWQEILIVREVVRLITFLPDLQAREPNRAALLGWLDEHAYKARRKERAQNRSFPRLREQAREALAQAIALRPELFDRERELLATQRRELLEQLDRARELLS